MAFDDPIFLFGFAPVIVVLCSILRRWAPDLVAPALLCASIVFYLMTDPVGALVMAPLIIGTALCIEAMSRFKRQTRMIAAIGVSASVLALAVWKYAPDAFPIQQPLGLSFVTFLNVSAILDVAAGRAEKLPLSKQALFSGFFATISAGPITRFSELSSQLRTLGHKTVSQDQILLGLALCVMGLGKAVIIGRPLLFQVDVISQAVASGREIAFLEAWFVVISSFTGLYFVFSGYSDIAMGLGLAVGLKLAVNFNSPLKSKGAADFFQRWHISLSKWVEVYVFSPLMRTVTRLPFGSTKTRRTVAWAVGTIISTTLIAAWHGATPFLALAGLCFGLWIVAVQLPGLLWKRQARATHGALRKVVGRLSFLAITAPTVFVYLSGSVDVFLAVGRELINPFRMSLATSLADQLSLLSSVGVRFEGFFPLMSGSGSYWISHLVLATGLALVAPNSMEIFGLLSPKNGAPTMLRKGLVIGMALGIVAALALGMPDHGGGFVYENF